MTKNLKVIVADDHAMFRRSLISILKGFDFIKKVKEAQNGEELLVMIRKEPPDLVLLDLEMPVMDGFEASQLIVEQYPGVRILILTMHQNTSFVNYLWNSGVHGYILKTSEIPEMREAILSVVEKDFYRNKVMETNLKKQEIKFEKFDRLPNSTVLTSRERQILRLICKEYTSKEIAEDLSLSRRTVEKSRITIMEKLNLKGTVELVKYAVKNNLA